VRRAYVAVLTRLMVPVFSGMASLAQGLDEWADAVED